MIFQANRNQKRWTGTYLEKKKKDFMPERVKRDKGSHYIIMNGSGIIIINTHAHNT